MNLKFSEPSQGFPAIKDQYLYSPKPEIKVFSLGALINNVTLGLLDDISCS